MSLIIQHGTRALMVEEAQRVTCRRFAGVLKEMVAANQDMQQPEA